MATVTGSAPKQDMPPPGGYRSIPYKRVPAKSYFKGWTLIGGYFGVTAVSTYLYYLNCKKVQRVELEMRSGLLAITPLLQAEKDRAYLKQIRKNREDEAELMKNVDHWEVGTFYGDPLFKTIDKDTLQKPDMRTYYVHTSEKEFNKKFAFKAWT